MMAKAKKTARGTSKTPATKCNPNVIRVTGFVGDTNGRAIAHSLTCPSTQAASTIQTFEKSEHDINGLVEELSAQVAAVNSGNMKRAEAMLITQAYTLNELFNNMARRAGNQNHLTQYETYMRLALKSQSQCRATLETLANIKNPPVVFANQANISHGHQQINNGVQAHNNMTDDDLLHIVCAGKNTNQQNELLEVQHGSETMDTRAASEAIGNDSAMATVGEIDRG